MKTSTKKKPKWMPKITSSEWVQPKRKYYYMGCCDCGLVHKIEFALAKRGARNFILLRAWRDEKATKRLRKRDNIRVTITETQEPESR